MINRLNDALRSRTFFKAISGLDVFDREAVLKVVRAAAAGGAHAVDVAADPDLVAEVRRNAPDLIVFASATDPQTLVESGADVLELGNYDAMYRAGQEPTAAQVLDWTRAVVASTGGNVPLCVTLPGRLTRSAQVDLAVQLQAAGADLLQTEGILGPRTPGVAGAITHLLEALANTSAVREAVDLPLILAGGVDPQNAPHAIAAGADGVGVGRYLKDAGTEADMTEAVSQVRKALAALREAGQPLKR
jgi:thiamine monophosphate synthase